MKSWNSVDICNACGLVLDQSGPLVPQRYSTQTSTAQFSIMSYIVINPISGELSSSNSSGSCNHSVEQLPHYCWSDQEEWGGVELIGSSRNPESWQQLDESYENRIYVQNLKEEILSGDHLEQVMSPNMWMAATEPLVQSVQDAVQQQCDEPYRAPVQGADTPLSPTYELHLQDYQLQEQILADEYVEQEEQSKAEPSDLEPLSGSWLDTISCVDQLDSSFTINQVTQPINTPIHYSNESQSSPTDSYETNYKFEISSVDSDNYVIAGYNDNTEITSTVDSYETDNLSNDETAEMVTLQLMDELKALQKQLADGDSCSTSLDPADINDLISQMFGESVVADADQLTTVDSESLWSSGYGDSCSEPALFSPEGSTLSVVFEEDVTTQITKIIDRKYSKEVKFGLESLEENSVDDDDDDDDVSEDDYSDDSLSDEEFVPSSYSRLTGTKRKPRRAARTTGKRKRREEYALLTPTEKRERKREQNKNAATKYREKKRYEELEREDACDELEKKNEELRREVMEKEREVKVLRRLVINIFRQPGNEALASGAAATALMSGGSGSLKKKRTVKKRECVEMF